MNDDILETRDQPVDESKLRDSFTRLMNELVATKRDLQQKNAELQKALDDVKLLSGLIPICANCKQIRDDKGYWQSVENYISQHSQAEFSHSICPDCVRKLYPELADKILKDIPGR